MQQQQKQNIQPPWAPCLQGESSIEDYAWPELGSGNYSKHFVSKTGNCSITVSVNPKRLSLSAGEKVMQTNLNYTEYPMLGEKINKNKSSNDSDGSSDVRNAPDDDGATVMIDMVKTQKRCKRTDKIYIDLQEVFENSKCFRKVRGKKSSRASIKITVNASLKTSKNKCKEVKKTAVKTYLTKHKYKQPSSLKKIILLDREIKTYIKVQNQPHMEAENSQAINDDIDNINLNKLEITSDGDKDSDYVKQMSKLSFYGAQYRDPKLNQIEDGTSTFRTDVINKLKKLNIGINGEENNLENSNAHFAKIFGNIIDNCNTFETNSLQISHNNETGVDNVIPQEEQIKFSRMFRE